MGEASEGRAGQLAVSFLRPDLLPSLAPWEVGLRKAPSHKALRQACLRVSDRQALHTCFGFKDVFIFVL